MEIGKKNDIGKTRFDLIPWEWVKNTADVFEYGSLKYGEYNWQKGIDSNRLFSALMRHITAYWQGEDNDLESGKSHLAHASANIAILMEMIRNHPELDNRPNIVYYDKKQ